MQASIPLILGMLFFSFLISFPCGYIRQNFTKFTFMWFFWIHLPIPFIVLSRAETGLDWHAIPLTLFGSVLGQLAGGYMKKRRL
jgi:hypothetical protein